MPDDRRVPAGSIAALTAALVGAALLPAQPAGVGAVLGTAALALAAFAAVPGAAFLAS